MNFVFYVLSAVTVVGGLAAVMLRNTVHCALALTVAFAGLALLFLKLGAQFAGFVQVLVYIGAVAILVVFAILLTRGSETPQQVYSRYWIEGLVIAAGVFTVLGWAVLGSARVLPYETAAPSATVLQIGNALMGRYVLPLEMIAVLLTAAMIGAVIVAMSKNVGTK